MTQMVTRCPKCATAFRITSTQLDSAKGAVRCGSCLHIFKAQDYLIKPVAPEPSPSEQPNTAQALEPIPESQTVIHHHTSENIDGYVVGKTSSEASKSGEVVQDLVVTEDTTLVQTPEIYSASESNANAQLNAETSAIDKTTSLEDDEDILISDDMDKTERESTYEFDGFLDMDLHPKQTVSLFEREIRYEPLRDEETPDETWAEELMDDDEETLHQFKKRVAQIAPLAAGNEDDAPPAHSTSDTFHTEPVFSLVDENLDEHQSKEEPYFSEAFLNATGTSEPVPESTVFASALFDQQPEEDSEKTSSRRPLKSQKMRAFDTSRAALLMNIMPAPVELTARRIRRWYQKRLWPTLAMLMAILLFCQIAYFKFDYFSRVEPYRTAYLFACPLFGCEVPTLVDTSQILATNLIVRNHPDISNALMVDAILINNAPFEQPFPDLILSFSKLDETLVASRRFTPKDYLGGELSGMKYIPERQPVHITLEISDPGAEAVNYTLATH